MNEIVAVPAVTEIVCAVSGAVNMTVTPLVVESGVIPTLVVQAALPGECVRLTNSPTPIVVRVRAPGDVASVWLVMASGGAGAGPGGAGAGPGGVGAGPGGAGAGPGGAGAGPGGAGAGGPGAANSLSKVPIVIGPTMPSGANPRARW